jgi:hypothetical protein
VLTEGSDWSEKQRRVAGGMVRAAGRHGAHGGGRCRGSPGSWAPRFGSGKTCEGATGVREVRGSPAVRDRGGGAKYQRRSSGAIPAVARAGVTGEGLGKLPGTEAELLRGLAGVEVQRGSGSTVEQGVLRGGARRAVALGFDGGRRV